jgi:hypothetical protein
VISQDTINAMIQAVRKVYEIKPRIYIILRGGLGNQLHQIAAGVKYAEGCGGRVRIFAHIVDTAIDPERRGFFRKVPINELFPGVHLKQVNLLEASLLRVIIRSFPRFFMRFQVAESNFHHKQNSKIVFLRGWFQSHTYLPRNFRPDLIHSQNFARSRQIIIHVRLTDFLDLDKFPLKRDYYKQAIEVMSKRLVVNSFDCYSDDLKNVGDFLPSNLSVNYPEEKNKLDPVALLYSLSSGSGLICSRSSLCWWAAQIVSSRGGTVISPWRGNAHRDDWLSLNSSIDPKEY